MAAISTLLPSCRRAPHTTFALPDAAVARTEVSWYDTVTTTVTVTNTGERPGDEVVQLYVRDPAASVTRPVLEAGRVTVASDPAGRPPGTVYDGAVTIT